MKKFFIILLIFLIILVVTVYFINTYRTNLAASQKINQEYEDYYHREGILGTELISIINRTDDINNKNEVKKDEAGYYIDNEKNSIHITINFIYQDDIQARQMEDIEKSGSESFIRVYSTAKFKCTQIEYHEKTKNVKRLIFEEVAEN